MGIDHIAQHHHMALPVGVELPEGLCAKPDIQGLFPEDVQHRELPAGAKAGRAVVQHRLGTRVLRGHFVHAAAVERTRCQTGSAPPSSSHSGPRPCQAGDKHPVPAR